MATAVVGFVGSAVGSKLIGFALDKVLGIQVEGGSVGAWGEQIALGIFMGKGLIPDLTFEQKVDLRFAQLDQEISGLRQDIQDLKRQMEGFQWQVQALLYEAREEDLWQVMLQIENSTEGYYKMLSDLGASKASLDERRLSALDLAKNIISGPLLGKIQDSKLALLGDSAGAGNERVRGFIEIWKQQMLREADLGWTGTRLSAIYNLVGQKFTRTLLIQFKCGRLLMEAFQAKHLDRSTDKGAADYFADTFYPMLVEEVKAFRDIIESVAINLLPLPSNFMGAFDVPGEIAGMLASLDVFTAQALGGKISNQTAPVGGRDLSGVPALSGCWGRVVVPGTRWIRRSPGAKENARVLLAGAGQNVTLNGTLEVRAIDYIPYPSQNGDTLHQGYQLNVGNEPRDMEKMLIAHFTPSDVLPSSLSGSFTATVEDANANVLATATAYVFPVAVDDSPQNNVPFGTFSMTFTGGAGIRNK
jgi:hypothetical protein